MSAFSAVHYVDATGGADLNSGSTPDAAWKSFANATNSAKVLAGDTVLLKCGETWFEQFTMPNSSVTLSNYGTGAKPRIDGTGAGIRIGVLCNGVSNTVTRGIVITNIGGLAPPNDTGASFEADGVGTNYLFDSEVRKHQSDDNVAANEGATLIVSNILNEGAFDQAFTMHSLGATTTLIVRSCIESNCYEAFKNSGGPFVVDVADSTFQDNGVADVDGLDNSTATFSRCRFNGRHDGTGWAFFRASTTPTTFNYCLFDASHSTGGITGPTFVANSTTVLDNCTFYGGTRFLGNIVINVPAPLNATNCIFYSWWQMAYVPYESFTLDHCIVNSVTIANWTTSVAVSTQDPLFVDPSGGDFTLQAGSPAINAGIYVGLTTDLQGNTVANPPDIGTFELLSNSPPALRLNLFSIGSNGATLLWTAIPGQTYRVQYKTNLADSVWQSLAPDVTATDSTAILTDTNLNPATFYRLQVMP